MPKEQEDFDLEDFCEMMSAYISGFENISRETVYEWMFDTTSAMRHDEEEMPGDEETYAHEADLDTTSDHASSHSRGLEAAPATSSSVPHEQDEPTACVVSGGEESRCKDEVPGASVNESKNAGVAVVSKEPDGATQTLIEDTPSSSACSNEEANPGDVTLLQDMFPDQDVKLLSSVLVRCGGVLEEAVSVLLAEAADTLEVHGAPKGKENSLRQCSTSQWQHRARRLSHSESSQDGDEEGGGDLDRVKDYVVSRFMLVDEAEDERHHRPHLTAKEKKKMVRYRDNHVVSTKGERFSLVAKKEQEDDAMKKTYVNLKPLRKYRFH